MSTPIQLRSTIWENLAPKDFSAYDFENTVKKIQVNQNYNF